MTAATNPKDSIESQWRSWQSLVAGCCLVASAVLGGGCDSEHDEVVGVSKHVLAVLADPSRLNKPEALSVQPAQGVTATVPAGPSLSEAAAVAAEVAENSVDQPDVDEPKAHDDAARQDDSEEQDGVVQQHNVVEDPDTQGEAATALPAADVGAVAVAPAAAAQAPAAANAASTDAAPKLADDRKAASDLGAPSPVAASATPANKPKPQQVASNKAPAQASEPVKAARHKPAPAPRVVAPAKTEAHPEVKPDAAEANVDPSLDATDLYWKGKRELEAGKLDAAIVDLTASMQRRPSDRTGTLLGRALFDAGRLSDAERVLKAAPRHADALLLLATLYQHRGRSELARRAYTSLLTYFPDHPRATWVRSMLRTL